MAWALAESADVMLCEDGEWVWEYLDGSSNEEVMINEMAAAGIAQVMPAGNLTGGGMQKTMTVNGNDSTTATFTGGQSSSVWPSVRWRGGLADVVVRLQVGTSEFIVLPGDGSTITIGGKSVYSNKSISSRGTVMMAIYVASSGFTTYNVRVINTTASQLRIEGMLGDDGFSWSGLARWSAPSENNTVTWPATADSAIGVGAYKNKASDTNINSFSGRGTRIDGTWPVDVTAPGSTVYSIGRNVTYVPFGGTSSAGPHVAGAAALILQADTALRHKEVQELLRTGAIADGFTGTVPNTTWGYGKLRIVNSLLPVITSVYDDQSPSAWKLLQNYPNPFNPKTKIVYEVPGSGSREFVELRVFDVLGREVTTLVNGERSVGSYSVEFDASNLASGVYFYRLRGSGFSITRKLMVLR
jgi:subtilisin family serine protease